MELDNEIVSEKACLNCGSTLVSNYCAECGQKAQATRQPIRVFLSDAVETLFNIDSRWLKTFKDLFLKPGQVTKKYIEGKRASYLPPLRIYLSISIIYFLCIQLVDSNQIFFINFSDDDGSAGNLGKTVQYALFFLVPVFAFLAGLLYRKRKGYYVEYLILSFHIHSVWFVFLMVELFTVWLSESSAGQWAQVVSTILSVPAQFATFIYVVLYLKHVFEESWWKSILKSFGIMTIYMATLAGLMAFYFLILMDWFNG